MLTKLKINLIAILMCVCLTSVGFSAWTITGTSPSVNVSSTINVDRVINSNNYIEPIGNIQAFTYCDSGFVNENNGVYTITNEGYITANYTLMLSECKKLFTSNSLKATFTLNVINSTISNANGFMFYGILNQITINDTAISFTALTANNATPVVSYTFENVLNNVTTTSNSTMSVTLKYKLVYTDQSAFDGILRVLNNNNGSPVGFKIDAVLTSA